MPLRRSWLPSSRGEPRARTWGARLLIQGPGRRRPLNASSLCAQKTASLWHAPHPAWQLHVSPGCRTCGLGAATGGNRPRRLEGRKLPGIERLVTRFGVSRAAGTRLARGGHMPGVFEPEPSKPDFLGQILSKSSPVLTWKPVKVQRITPTPPSPDVVDLSSEADRTSDGFEASISRASRATTRRMVAWPVLPGLTRERGRMLRALGTLVAFSLLCGAALTVCVYVLLGGDSAIAARPKPAPTRVAVTHVAEPTFDTLLPAAVALPAPVTLEPHKTAARPARGRPASHSPALHARSTRAPGGANRGTT
jgi:hypothetical protein